MEKLFGIPIAPLTTALIIILGLAVAVSLVAPCMICERPKRDPGHQATRARGYVPWQCAALPGL